MEQILITIIFRFSFLWQWGIISDILLLPYVPQNCFYSQNPFPRGFIGVTGQGCVLDAKQIGRLQQEPGRDMREKMSWQDSAQYKWVISSNFLSNSSGSHLPTCTCALYQRSGESPSFVAKMGYLGKHTAWSVATRPMGISFWPLQQSWKQRSQSLDELSRDVTLWKSQKTVWVAPAPKFSEWRRTARGWPYKKLLHKALCRQGSVLPYTANDSFFTDSCCLPLGIKTRTILSEPSSMGSLLLY